MRFPLNTAISEKRKEFANKSHKPTQARLQYCACVPWHTGMGDQRLKQIARVAWQLFLTTLFVQLINRRPFAEEVGKAWTKNVCIVPQSNCPQVKFSRRIITYLPVLVTTWQQSVGFVPQRTFLLGRTVGSNYMVREDSALQRMHGMSNAGEHWFSQRMIMNGSDAAYNHITTLYLIRIFPKQFGNVLCMWGLEQ